MALVIYAVQAASPVSGVLPYRQLGVSLILSGLMWRYKSVHEECSDIQ